MAYVDVRQGKTLWVSIRTCFADIESKRPLAHVADYDLVTALHKMNTDREDTTMIVGVSGRYERSDIRRELNIRRVIVGQ